MRLLFIQVVNQNVPVETSNPTKFLVDIYAVLKLHKTVCHYLPLKLFTHTGIFKIILYITALLVILYLIRPEPESNCETLSMLTHDANQRNIRQKWTQEENLWMTLDQNDFSKKIIK